MVDIVDSVNNVICKDASLIQSELVNGNRETWRLALISILECEKQAEQYEQGSKPGSQAYAVWADIVANTKKAASILHQAISGDEKTLTRAQMSRLMGLQMLAHYAHSNPLGIPGLEVLSGVLLQALNSFMPPLESNSTLCLSSELVNGNQETWRLALTSILECEKQAEQYEQGSKPGSEAYAVWADILASVKQAASILHQAISGDEKTLTRAQMGDLISVQLLAADAHSDPLGIPGLKTLSGVLLQALNSFLPPLESNSTLCLPQESNSVFG